MPLTVAHVIALPELRLIVRTRTAPLDREVRWVAVSEHVDPTPWLAADDLLLTTGMALDLTPAAARAYVGRLGSAGVAGLGFGTGLTHQEVPPGLVEAAEHAGLPLFEVPEPVPFVALSKAVSRQLAAQEYAESAAAFDSQRRLLRAALSSGAESESSVEDSILRVVARHVGGFALLLDAEGSLLLSRPPSAAGRADDVRDEVARLRPQGLRGSASLASADEHVSVLPVGVRGSADAFLVAGSPRPLRPADQGVLSLAVSLLARPVAASAGPDGWRDLLVRHAQVAGIPDDLLASLGLGRIDAQRAVAVVVRAAPGGPAIAAWAADRNDLVLTPVRSGPVDTGLWEGFAHDDRSAGVLDELAATATVRAVGISAPADLRQADNVRKALAQAGDAARGRGVRRFGADGVGSLGDLVDAAETSAWARAYLAPLREVDEGPELVETVRAWLGVHGQVDAAAQHLGIHRHTVRHRLRRAETSLGRSLDDPQVRADLWFALLAHAPATETVTMGE